MSLRLVIPVGATPKDLAFDRPIDPFDKDSPRDSTTWIDVAKDAGVDGIEEFGSAWCVEHAIDGLGICTELSGQESDAQKAERAEREAVEVKRSMTVERLLGALVDKNVLSAAEAVDIADPVKAEPAGEVKR